MALLEVEGLHAHYGQAHVLHGVGLAVRQIVDVAAAESPLQAGLGSDGVAGSLSLGGLATEVLDLDSARAFART